MPDFPDIGCHAVAQYPSSHEVHVPTVIQHYVDGSEQRFADHPETRRIWRINLQALSETDAARLREFYLSVTGRASSFRFRDPWTGDWFAPCWFEDDMLTLEHIQAGLFIGEIQIYAKDVFTDGEVEP